MDGYGSHIYNVEFMSLMKKHGAEIVCIPPPHCTHWMQPADKALFRAMKSNWEESGNEFFYSVHICVEQVHYNRDVPECILSNWDLSHQLICHT